MRKTNILFLTLAFCIFISGCATQRGWRYSAEPKKFRKPVINKTVAVLPFKDARPDKNTNALMMYLIPLMPYGWCDYSIPESGNMKLNSIPIWQFKPTEDFAKAAAEELEASGLFKEVFFTQRPSEGNLVLLGTIRSTRYWGKMISYGLSAYGPVLWFIGLPAGSVHNELAVEFELKDNLTNSLLWSDDFRLTYDKGIFTLYNMPSDFAYDILYKDIMLRSIEDMEDKLSQ